jgi:hypothetical protein
MTLQTTNHADAILEKVVIEGDLSQLSPTERLKYYRSVCESLGLNPLTRPFEYLKLSGKLVLYAKKDAAEQLSARHHISLELLSAETIGDVRIVTYRAHEPGGRFVDATGVVTIGNLRGDNLANALMKCETKARRRSTLAIVGLGWLDETETETIQGAQRVEVDHDTGEIIGSTPLSQPEEEQKAPDPRYFCQEHRTEWQKRGNTKGESWWSHPVKGQQGTWCQMDPPPVPQLTVQTPQNAVEQRSGPTQPTVPNPLDLETFKELAKERGWTPYNVKTWLRGTTDEWLREDPTRTLHEAFSLCLDMERHL